MKNKKQRTIDSITMAINLLAILIIGLFAAGALRQNNLTMLKLRDEVFKADESGVGVDGALKKLRNHVSSHMNSELPKLGSEKAIQLKYSYERSVGEEAKRFQAETELVSASAKAACSSSRNELSKVECEQSYIKAHPVSPRIDILPEQYSIEFISPVFSFDLAGWLIISAVFATILFIARLIALRLASTKIKHLYN